jgi:hypothetical protein
MILLLRPLHRPQEGLLTAIFVDVFLPYRLDQVSLKPALERCPSQVRRGSDQLLLGWSVELFLGILARLTPFFIHNLAPVSRICLGDTKPGTPAFPILCCQQSRWLPACP